MPTTRSAKKRLKQSLTRRLKNRAGRSTLRTQTRRVQESLTAGDAAKAETEYRVLTKKLDQAASQGLIHANAAARVKSRISAKIKAAKKPATKKV